MSALSVTPPATQEFPFLLERGLAVGAYTEPEDGPANRTIIAVEIVHVAAGLGGMLAALAAPFVAGGLLLLAGFSAVDASALEIVSSPTIVDSSRLALTNVTFFGAVLAFLGATVFVGGAAIGVVLESRPRRRSLR